MAPWRRLIVRTTTRARRRVSMGFPGDITDARASKIGLVASKGLSSPPWRRNLPAASTALSEMKGCLLDMP